MMAKLHALPHCLLFETILALLLL